MQLHRLPLLLTLLAAPAAAAEAPRAAANPKADPAAYQLLKAAYERRQVTPSTLTGFDATVVYTEGPRTATGKLSFRYGGQSAFTVDGLSAADTAWLRHQVLSIANHRGGGDFDAAEGRFPLAFGPGPDTDFGRLIERNDGDGSSSRVRDGKILELTRSAGQRRFTISILDTMECDPGRYVPTRYVVTYRDRQSGALQETAFFHNSYAKVGRYWLPIGRRVFSVTGNETPRSRSFTFQEIRVHEKP